MYLEVAMLNVDPDGHAKFEADARTILKLIRDAEGCEGVELHKSVERAGGYTLHVRWRALEDHTTRFRQTDAFTKMIGLLKVHLVAPPQMEHTTKVLEA